jgi:hypothetical protein
MATVFKSVGNRKYFKLDECEVGQVLVQGTYAGSQPNKMYPSSVNHLFRSTEGPTVVLSGGHLNYLIDSNEVANGQLVQITYMGKQKIEKGKFKGKNSHQFDLAIAESDEQLADPNYEELESIAMQEAGNTGVDLASLD